MWNNWTIGLGIAAFIVAVGAVVWVTQNQSMRRFHGYLQFVIVGWTIVGAATVVWADGTKVFDWVMALGLLLMTGLTGYLHYHEEDPTWTKAVHYGLGLLLLGWYAVLAYRYSPL